jgi:hypothetical protein
MKVILDGYGYKVKAIKGQKHWSEDLHPEDFHEIIIETDKGNFWISGCGNCGALSFGKVQSSDTTAREQE